MGRRGAKINYYFEETASEATATNVSRVGVGDLNGNAVQLHFLHEADQVNQTVKHLLDLKVVPVALNPLFDNRANPKR